MIRLGTALLAVLLAAAADGSGGLAADEPSGGLAADAADAALDARARLAEGLYLESGLGDSRGALEAYEQVVAGADLPRALAAEALMRAGLARERLEEVERAEEDYQRLLRDFPETAWAAPAQQRLRALDEDRKKVQALPLLWAFDRDLAGLVHARSRATKGRLSHEIVDEAGRTGGVASWRTWVTTGEDDAVLLGFSPDLAVEGRVAVLAHALAFPAHLVFVLVDEQGSRTSSRTFVVRPEAGWTEVRLGPEDFVDRSRGPEERAFAVQRGTTLLMIRDVTGSSSTDRGENVLLLDDLSVS